MVRLPIRQRADRVVEHPAELGALGGGLRIDGGGVSQQLADGGPAGGELVERHQAAFRHVRQGAAHLADADAEVVGELLFGTGTLQPVLQLG